MLASMDGKWERHSTQQVYENQWMKVDVAKVELPDGETIDHHLMHPHTARAACTLCYDPDKGVLVIWRHRFINDHWGWEFPAGGVEAGEQPVKGAEREMLEETGWKPKTMKKLLSYQPMAGAVACHYDCFFAEGAEWVGPGRDINEAADVAWVSLDQLRDFITGGEMTEGMSLTSALFAFQFGPLKDK